MNRCRLQNLTFLVVIVLLVWSSLESLSAREYKQLRRPFKATLPSISNKKVRTRHGNRLLINTAGTYTASKHVVVKPSSSVESSVVFDVSDYGAKGDGHTDDTKAFEASWTSACKSKLSTILVPGGSVFLVKPISFSGLNCESNIVFKIDGKIIAPTNSKDWDEGLLHWIEFIELTGITITGDGSIDGQGSVWWNDSLFTSKEESEFEDTNNSSTNNLIDRKLSGNMPRAKPTALRFYKSSNVVVTGITIQNSPQFHLKFDDCTGVQVFGMNVSSPGDSPNTDGIHLQNTQDVRIHNNKLACGDDCVSIQTGSSNIHIHDIDCGPGHGISIGGLGKDNSKACVSNITVQDITIHNTMFGVRIKTWQGGSGSVQGVVFSNIQVSEVEIPIMIDQFYCDRSNCKNETAAVAVSAISYEHIRGTYTVKPVHFACSDSLPCTNVSLDTIDLKSVQEDHQLFEPFCSQIYGELVTTTVPPVECLQMGEPSTGEAEDPDSC